MAIKRVVEIVADTKQAASQIKELFDDLLNKEQQAKKEQDKLNESVEDLGKKASKTKKGLKSVSSGFKNIGLAIKGAGIGILIGLFSLLKTALEKNTKAQKAFKVVAEFVSAVVGELVDVIDSVVTTVADSTNGFESLGKVLGGILTLVLNPFKFAFLGIGLAISEAQLIWEKSFFGDKDPKTIKALNESINESKEKIKELGNETAKAGGEIISNFAGAVKEVGQLGRAVVDELGEVDIKASILRKKTEEAEAESAKKAEQRRKKAQQIADENARNEAARLKAIQDLQNQFIKENQDLDAKTREEKLELERQRAQEDLDNLIGTETEKREAQLALDELFDQKEAELKEQRRLDKEQKDKEAFDKDNQERLKAFQEKQRLADEEEKREQALNDAKVGFAKQGLSLVGALAEEGSAIGKGVAVAQATISGIEGVQNAFKTAQSSPITTLNPAYPFIQAGIAGAFSAIQIKKILSTNPSGKGVSASSSGGGGSAGGGGGISAPSFNLVQGTGSNQIAEGLNTQNEPIKAFVVSGDVTTAQNLDNNIIEDGSI